MYKFTAIDHMENTEYKINRTGDWLIGYNQNTSFCVLFTKTKNHANFNVTYK